MNNLILVCHRCFFSYVPCILTPDKLCPTIVFFGEAAQLGPNALSMISKADFSVKTHHLPRALFSVLPQAVPQRQPLVIEDQARRRQAAADIRAGYAG
jgi:hypothetical protein